MKTIEYTEIRTVQIDQFRMIEKPCNIILEITGECDKDTTAFIKRNLDRMLTIMLSSNPNIEIGRIRKFNGQEWEILLHRAMWKATARRFTKKDRAKLDRIMLAKKKDAREKYYWKHDISNNLRMPR